MSIISNVERIGYELVKSPKRQKRGHKTATMQQYAKINFEPWEETRPIPPNPEDLLAWGTNARIAYQTMTRTKEQLIEMVDGLDVEILDNVMACIEDAGEHFKAMVLVCDMAFQRILVAASAHQVAKGKAEKRRTSRRKAVAS